MRSKAVSKMSFKGFVESVLPRASCAAISHQSNHALNQGIHCLKAANASNMISSARLCIAIFTLRSPEVSALISVCLRLSFIVPSVRNSIEGSDLLCIKKQKSVCQFFPGKISLSTISRISARLLSSSIYYDLHAYTCM